MRSFIASTKISIQTVAVLRCFYSGHHYRVGHQRPAGPGPTCRLSQRATSTINSSSTLYRLFISYFWFWAYEKDEKNMAVISVITLRDRNQLRGPRPI